MIETVTKIINTIDNSITYKIVLQDNSTIFVPLDPANLDYQAIQEWIADGGVVIDNPPM